MTVMQLQFSSSLTVYKLHKKWHIDSQKVLGVIKKSLSWHMSAFQCKIYKRKLCQPKTCYCVCAVYFHIYQKYYTVCSIKDQGGEIPEGSKVGKKVEEKGGMNEEGS